MINNNDPLNVCYLVGILFLNEIFHQHMVICQGQLETENNMNINYANKEWWVDAGKVYLLLHPIQITQILMVQRCNWLEDLLSYPSIPVKNERDEKRRKTHGKIRVFV